MTSHADLKSGEEIRAVPSGPSQGVVAKRVAPAPYGFLVLGKKPMPRRRQVMKQYYATATELMIKQGELV